MLGAFALFMKQKFHYTQPAAVCSTCGIRKRMSAQPEQKVRAGEQQSRSALLVTTLIVGVLLGASLGPTLFLAVRYLELSGDQLFSFVVGVFATFGVCLVIAGVSALLIVPRIFSSARGTLTAMVDDLREASRAHSAGDPAKALDHFGRAVGEGAAWYSIGASRRFVAQAALGLLISFGGILGAVLLLSQNSLLREQNVMIKSQLKLLTDQNEKIDQQVKLLVDQNGKIEQQTMVADAQRRGAFLTEMFSILQDVSKSNSTDVGAIPKELVTRIVVLTSSAIPYFYLDYQGESTGKLKPIQRALSPERGQIIAALARMKVKNLSLLSKAGAQFAQADLRGTDLSGVDLTGTNLTGCDLTGANLTKANFKKAIFHHAILDRVSAEGAMFNNALIGSTSMNGSHFVSSSFDGALLSLVTIRGGDFSDASFIGAGVPSVKFEEVTISSGELPKGLPWPKSVRDGWSKKSVSQQKKTVSHEFGKIDWNEAPPPPGQPIPVPK